MFDTLDEPALLAEMADAQRGERVVVARRVLATGRLCQSRMSGLLGDDRATWCIDNWAATAAEVGAHLGMSQERASVQMNQGLELLERLPRVAEAFAAGEVEYRVIATLVFRTGLITDDAVMARIDEVLSRRVRWFNTLSRKRLAAAIDKWVAEVDPAAVRTAREARENRYIEFGEAIEGMVRFWGSVRVADAAVLDRRLEDLAAAAPEGSGTLAQRRADALVALAAGGVPGQSAPVVITVIAEAAAVRGDAGASATSGTSGYLPGYGAVPPAMVRELADGARLVPLTPPALLCTEPGYRPSAALARFVRCRDLGCRFPGCTRPAEVCDIDHTIPFGDGGPTHPSNLALLCRLHHLLKTFWTGEKGWRVTQFPNGRLEWTSPTGCTYTTKPAGALLYPQLGQPTGDISVEVRPPRADACRALKMPTRQHTRDDERAARIAWERGLNEARWAADPPPF